MDWIGFVVEVSAMLYARLWVAGLVLCITGVLAVVAGPTPFVSIFGAVLVLSGASLMAQPPHSIP